MKRYPKPNMGEYAGVLDRRAEALLLDGLLVGIVAGVLGFVGGTLLVGSTTGGIGGAFVAMQLGTPIVFMAYQIGFEGYYGRTIGKALRGLVVVKTDGSEMSWTASLLRNVLRLVDALPVLYVLGIVVAYLRDEHQRIGDVVADTVVVYTAD